MVFQPVMVRNGLGENYPSRWTLYVIVTPTPPTIFPWKYNLLTKY